MTDIEIARNAKLKPITQIGESLGITEEELEQYGKFKAKINQKAIDRLQKKKNGKLILVTAMTPTRMGEGKTTVSIAIADGLRKINKNAVLALREPSLGPVFGIKGGATGGGKVQVAPMEDINLHFTGDIHAMTAANNLLSAIIDNHIYFGNELKIKKVTWKRCLDLNDRQLRVVNTGLSGETKIVPREDGFDITVASEIMAIMCLATDLEDLKKKIGDIIIGYNDKEKPVFARDLKAEGALTVLLKDALNPNLVQSLEHTPAIIHGGPFANIAHGCNSIRATKLALKLGDYVVTEAGFGGDLGAEKFLDIKCRKAELEPDAVVCVATSKAIDAHGIENLFVHLDNMKKVYGMNVIVAFNRYTGDTDKVIEEYRKQVEKRGYEFSLVEGWAKGGDGAIDIAEKLTKMVEKPSKLTYSYELKEDIKTKILNVAQKVYRAKEVEYSEEAIQNLARIEKLGFGNLPVCIAKTQYSLSDDDKNLLCDNDYNIHVRDVILKSGAGFIVVLAGKIMTMPGLPKVPAAESIDIDENGEIVGIF